MENMKRILFVPAWWPASFFIEQQNLTEDEYVPYLLLQKAFSYYPLKSFPSYLLKRFDFSIDNSNRTASIDFSWLRHKFSKLNEHQNRRLSNRIGDVIMQLMDGHKPNLIHMQSLSCLSPFVVLWAKKNKVPVIMTEHQLQFRIMVDPFSCFKYSVYRNVDHLLCVSNYLFRHLLINEFGIRSGQVIGNFVNDDKLQKQFLNAPRNGRILFVAAHPAQKDIRVLLDVAALLVGTDKKIDIIGFTGDEYLIPQKTFSQDIKDRGLDTVLRIKGKMSHCALLGEFSKYSVLLSTSRSETFGLCVAESIMCGTPVVCTDSGGIRDFVKESNGIVVGIKQPLQIKDALLKCLDTQYDRQRMSSEIVGMYGRHAFTETLLNIYERYAK